MEICIKKDEPKQEIKDTKTKAKNINNNKKAKTKTKTKQHTQRPVI